MDESGYLAEEARVVSRLRPHRFLAGAAALIVAGTVGYIVGDADPPMQSKRLSGSTLLSCEGLPRVLMLQVAGLDPDQEVQVAVNVGSAEYLITPDRPLLRGLPVERGLRPDADGRIEMVRHLDFSPPAGTAEYVVYKAGSLSEVIQRERLARLPCTEG